MESIWSAPRSWANLRQAGEETLSADDASRARIALFLELEALDRLVATLAHEPWLDGVRVHGRIEALAIRLCGVSLDPFEEPVETTFDLRFVPEGSPNAPATEAELIVALDADDPPEVIQGDAIDLASYVIEMLGLALDPFPRKPGVVFDYAYPAGETSPFAILKFAKSEDRG